MAVKIIFIELIMTYLFNTTVFIIIPLNMWYTVFPILVFVFISRLTVSQPEVPALLLPKLPDCFPEMSLCHFTLARLSH